MHILIVSLRVAARTSLVCSGAYTLLVLGIAQALVPDTADGSLITRADGTVVGSRLVAQRFEQPRYFWPRPSAPDYDAMAAAGSNDSPTSTDVATRGAEMVARYGATAERPLPPELATTSGSGLDPHITEDAARYQADRIADARGMPRARVDALIEEHAFAPGGVFTPVRLVNVLELNLALDDELRAK